MPVKSLKPTSPGVRGMSRLQTADITKKCADFPFAEGHRDFNGELTEPLYKQLASAWEKAFQRRLPHILQTFKRSASKVLKQFHDAVEARTREKGHGLARIAMLGTQLDAYSAIFGDLAQAAVDSFTEGQREINREFTPAIANAMNPAYEYCTNEAGTGSYARMKAGMAAHVDQEKSRMFDNAAKGVRQSLLSLCESIKKNMLDKADGVFVQMQRDYAPVPLPLVMHGGRLNDVLQEHGHCHRPNTARHRRDM